MSLNDVQTRLAETTGRWLVDEDGTVSVRLMALAEVVHEIGVDIAIGLVNREVAHHYQELAAAMRRGSHADRLVSVAEVLTRWAAALERRANALHIDEDHSTGGDQR
nr:hypothetical protein [Kibdelosporangium sp. MJ126-NF4]